MTGGSVRFDRAVEYYDRTRSLPPEVDARQRAILAAELAGADRVLEIGVGTGRIACGLTVAVIGLDLSRPMMEVLRTKSSTIPLVEGDATTLPFPDASFDAAYAAHVLHLIPTWRAALAELVRVVRPGGVVLAVRGSGRSDVGAELDAKLGLRVAPVGAHRIEDVDEGARDLGLTMRPLEEISWTAPYDLASEIESIQLARWSGLWDRTPDELRDAADRARAWAAARFGSIDAVVEATHAFEWHAYDVP